MCNHTIASGNASVSMGNLTNAKSFACLAIGQANDTTNMTSSDSWVPTDPVFVIGNGDISYLNNAFMVLKNGDTFIDKDLYVSGKLYGDGSSLTGVSDNLGDHAATQNILLNGNYISNDGQNEGISIDNSGFVGIGIADPLHALHVMGDGVGVIGWTYISPDELSLNYSRVGNGSSRLGFYCDDDAGYEFQMSREPGNDGRMFCLQTGTGKFGLGTSEAATLNLMTSNVDRLVIDQNGEIKIAAVYSDIVGTTNRDLYIDNTGKIGYISSAYRYKKQITDMENIDWIYNLRPVNYVYKSDKKRIKQYGLIAEEVEEVNPLFVSYNEEGEVETVSYSMLITPILKALQEQEKKNLKQQQIIESLELRVEQITIENERLQATHNKIEQLKAEIESIKAIIGK
jgi:hypothetical protein